MSRAVFPINFIIKRNTFLRYYKPSPCVLSQERYFSTHNDDNDGDQKPKGLPGTKTSNTSAAGAIDSSPNSKMDEKEGGADKKAAAKKKLFSLLSEFKVEPSSENKIAPNLNLAKAVKRPSKAERFKDLKDKKLSPKEELQVAVKNVAENVIGDPDFIKQELNKKLSSLNLADFPKDEEAIAEEDISEVDEKMKENIMSSVKEVAETVIDSKATSVKSKLTQRLLRLSIDDKSALHPKKSIDSLLKGMKIEKRDSKNERERTGIPDQAQRTMRRARTAINIFQSPPLDIFSCDELKIDSKKTVWKSLEEKNLKLLVQFAPVNGFEEMILWTEQGKHWKFPIDNEIDMGDEENVGFNEHVFLEHHLHGFPTKGPVRQFMELVTVGLSKNPYITVERKIENIDWFRNYFKEKEEILKHHGALG